MAAAVSVRTIVASKNTNHPGVPRANPSPIPKSNDGRNVISSQFSPLSLCWLDLGRKWGPEAEGVGPGAPSGDCATSEEAVGER